MTDIQVGRNLLAGVVMGWKVIDVPEPIDMAWYYADQKAMCLVQDWRPDTDLSQAMMVAERLRELGWEYTLIGDPSWFWGPSHHLVRLTWVGKNRMLYGYQHEGRDNTLSAAIFAAALKVAERMAEKGDDHAT